MPTIADYIILQDGAVAISTGTNTIRLNFKMPTNFVPEQRTVLMYRVEADNADGLAYTVTANGTEVLALTHNEDRFGTIHEVISANVLNHLDNRIWFQVQSGGGTLKISDVVLMFQATV